MQRAFPSQIVAYLESVYPTQRPTDIATIGQTVGALAAFVELYDHIPDELIRLPPDEYARLVSAIGTIRFGIDQYRLSANASHLTRVPPALSSAWDLLKLLNDEAPSTAHDLSFIADPDLRELIGVDVAAVATALQAGEWKGATIIAASCCEALLLYALQTTETTSAGAVASAVSAVQWPGRPPKSSDLIDLSWNLFAYTEIANRINLITDNTKADLLPTRNYRNLIHPGKVQRENSKCDRGTAFVATGALEHVLSDLKKSL